MKPTHHSFPDVSQENAQRIRRQRILQQSKKLDKKELWNGFLLAVFTGISIAGIVVIALFPAVQAVIDNPGVSTLLIIIGTLATIAGYLIVRSARKSRV